MDRLHKSLMTAVIVSETTHVFCCVLPTIFSLMGLLSGLGLVTTMPPFLDSLHTLIHDYEIPLISFSGTILAIGWLLYYLSRKIDCRNTGCEHEPCEPKKRKTHIILNVATVLFIINVSLYFGIHRSAEMQINESSTENIIHDHHHNHNHNH